MPIGVRLPSLGGRLAAGLGIFVGLGAFLILVPLDVLSTLVAHGVLSGITSGTIVLGGLLFAGLSAAAYVARPTRAYGPVCAGRSLAGILYLLLVAASATLSIPVGPTGSAVLGYSELILWLAIAPALGLVAAIAVTFADLKDPWARRRREFPG